VTGKANFKLTKENFWHDEKCCTSTTNYVLYIVIKYSENQLMLPPKFAQRDNVECVLCIFVQIAVQFLFVHIWFLLLQINFDDLHPVVFVLGLISAEADTHAINNGAGQERGRG